MDQTRIATRAGSNAAIAAIVRDIARGGLAGLIVGVVVLGPGARLVMRLHALIVPAATGLATENGNRIGQITVGGTVGLLLIAGLFGAILLGVVWVVASPWLPGGTLGRGLAGVPVAVALGAHQLIVLGNSDFIVLRHHPLVVGTLLALLAVVPLALSVVDAWLDRRLPRGDLGSPATAGYLGLAVLGGLFGTLLLVQLLSEDRTRPLGLVTIGLGALTLVWWVRRAGGDPVPPRALTLVARTILVAGAAASAIAVWPAIRFALPLP
jgi:hypothetical protein